MWLNSKTQIVTKLKNTNCDQNKKKFKLWQNSKTQIVTKLKNSNYDKTKKNPIVTKLKKSNCDPTQKIKLLHHSVVKVVTVVRVVRVVTVVTKKFSHFFLSLKFWHNLKTQIVTKLKNSNFDQTQKHKLWQDSTLKFLQNSKTQIVTKLKNLNKFSVCRMQDLMIYCWLIDDLLMIDDWLLDDLLMIKWWLIDDWMMIDWLIDWLMQDGEFDD